MNHKFFFSVIYHNIISLVDAWYEMENEMQVRPHLNPEAGVSEPPSDIGVSTEPLFPCPVLSGNVEVSVVELMLQTNLLKVKNTIIISE